MEDARKRLERVVKKRETLIADIERLKGKREEAERRVSELEEECKAKGIAPNQLEEALTKLRTRYETLVSKIEKEIEDAERRLQPFLEASR